MAISNSGILNIGKFYEHRFDQMQTFRMLGAVENFANMA
jgi:hypothetical protein